MKPISLGVFQGRNWKHLSFAMSVHM